MSHISASPLPIAKDHSPSENVLQPSQMSNCDGDVESEIREGRRSSAELEGGLPRQTPVNLEGKHSSPTTMQTKFATVPSQPMSVSLDGVSLQAPSNREVQNPIQTIPPLPRQEGLDAKNPLRTRQFPPKKSAQGPDNSQQCFCYEATLQRLSDFDESQTSLSSITIDLIMSIENDVRDQAWDILNCKSSSCNRPKTLLLVGVLLENSAGLLEDIMEIAVRAKKSIALQHEKTSRSPSLIDGYENVHQDSNSLHSFSLRVGAYEVFGEEKVTFLNQLIRLRLQNLSSAVQQLHEHMLQNRQSLYFKAGAAVVVEINRRVHLANSTLDQTVP